VRARSLWDGIMSTKIFFVFDGAWRGRFDAFQEGTHDGEEKWFVSYMDKSFFLDLSLS
jgi:hypothetical protein